MLATFSRVPHISANPMKWFLDIPLMNANNIIPATNRKEETELFRCDSFSRSERKNQSSSGRRTTDIARSSLKINMPMYCFFENIRENALHRRGWQPLNRLLLISCCHNFSNLFTRCSMLSCVRTGKISSFSRGLWLPSFRTVFIQCSVRQESKLAES